MAIFLLEFQEMKMLITTMTIMLTSSKKPGDIRAREMDILHQSCPKHTEQKRIMALKKDTSFKFNIAQALTD
jgi:hypothetical protein